MRAKTKPSQDGKEMLEFDLPLIIFKEDGTTICYCPSLDLSGYGYSEKEAVASYKYALGQYFEYTTEHHTLLQDLKRLGWLTNSRTARSLLPPPVTKLLQHNDNFKRVFEHLNYKKLSTSVRFSLS